MIKFCFVFKDSVPNYKGKDEKNAQYSILNDQKM